MLLSKTQKRVLAWIRHGHPVQGGEGQSIAVEGDHLCSHETMVILLQFGLVKEDANNVWTVTESGKALAEQLRL